MSIDQYSLCLCGSGKKLKWCCQDKLRDAAQIYRLISNKQFGHAREALEKKLEEFPDHPLFLRLKLDYFQAVAEGESEVSKLAGLALEAGVTAGILLLQRPHSEAAHQSLADSLPYTGDDAVEAALDYWERYFSRDIYLDAWLPYLQLLEQSNPLAVWWLSPVLQHLRRATPRVEALLRSVAMKLPGILGGLPYLPAARTEDTAPLARAILHVQQGMLRYAIAAAESEADVSPEAAYLAGSLRLAVGDRAFGIQRLADVLSRTQSPGLVLGAIVALWLNGGLAYTVAERTTVTIPASYAEEALRILSEGHRVDATDTWTVISRVDWKEADPIDPADLVLVYRATGNQQDALVVNIPDTEYWSDRLDKCQELGGEDSRAVMLLPPLLGRCHFEILRPLAMSMARAIREGDQDETELQEELFARLVRGLAQRPVSPVEPIRDRSLSELASSQDTRDRLIAQAIALTLERAVMARSLSDVRPWTVYEALGIQRPLYEPGRTDVPRWLAVLDIRNSPPTELLARLAGDPYPGTDIVLEALEVLFDRYDELDENHRALVLQILIYTLTEVPESADRIADRTAERVRRVVDAGLAPRWVRDYVDLFAGFARIGVEAEEEAHKEAATSLRRLLSQYAEADLRRFIGAVFGEHPLPGVPTQGPWSRLAQNVRNGIRFWLSTLQLVQFLSDKELGLTTAEEEEEAAARESGSVLVDFRTLARWMERFSRPVVVAPDSAGRLWTPDQGPPSSAPQEGEQPKRLWVPDQE